MQSFDLNTGRQREDERPAKDSSQGDAADKAIRLNEDLYDSYRTKQEPWATNVAQKSRELAANIIFTDEQIRALEARGQAPVSFPLLHRAKEQAKSLLTARQPQFSATGRDDSDTKKARVFADLMSWAWYKSDGNQHLKKALDDYYAGGGHGVLYVYKDTEADYGRGEVLVTDLDPLEVLPDPNSRDPLWRDAAHVLVSRRITREQAEAMWPDKVNDIAAARPEEGGDQGYSSTGYSESVQYTASVSDDLWHTHYRLIERYSKIRTPHYHVSEPVIGSLFDKERVFAPEKYAKYEEEPAFVVDDGQQRTVVIDDEGVQRNSEIFEQFKVSEDTAIFPTPAGEPYVDEMGQVVMPEVVDVMILKTTKGNLIASGYIRVRKVNLKRVQVTCTMGGRLMYQYVLPTEHFPIVPISNVHNRNPYTLDDAHYVRDMIYEFNKKQQIIISHAQNSAGITYWYQEGSVDDSVEEKMARPGAKLLPYRGETPPIPQQVIPLPTEFYINQDRVKAQIDETLGLYPFMQGDSANTPNTARMGMQVDESGLRRIKSKLDDIYASLNHLAKVWADLARDTYTREKVVRVLEPDGTERMTKINEAFYDEYGNVVDIMNDVAAIDCDVVFVAGSTLPSNRYAMLDYMIRMYEIGVIDQEEVLKKTEVFDTEGLLERSSQRSQMQRRIEELEEEVKTLKGREMRMDNELRAADRQVSKAKYDAQVARAEERVSKEAELTTQRLQDKLGQQERMISAIENQGL